VRRRLSTRELYALQHSPVQDRSWFAISNKKAVDGPALVHIYDEIGQYGIGATEFIKDLGKVKGDIELHLNSPGGEVFDGLAIYNALRQHQDGIVQIVIDSLAASIASVIAMAADPGNLWIADTASLMMHDGFGACMGSAADMRSLADVLERQSQNIAGIYAARAGRTAKYWRDLMTANGADGTWFLGQEAVDAGLADFVLGNGPVTASEPGRRDPDPAELRGQSGPYKKKADDDGDEPDDGMDNAAVDESAWDASKAWSAGSASDDPEAFFRAICAGEKTVGDPGTQAHWALPYKYSPSSPPNRRGVAAALAALGGARGGVKDLKDPAAAKAKLQKIMKQINPDYDPSDRSDVDLAALALAMKEMT
jgi:ATP-dependent protease ClpP protease subunit